MSSLATSPATLLGLDVGSRRIGVAVARADVRIAQPLCTLDAVDAPLERIASLADEHQAGLIVVGWPRGLDGQTTDQTRTVEAFVTELKAKLSLPVELQDEALTSQKAETELTQRGKPYDKADVDALAATFILEDYLATQTPVPAVELPHV